MLYFEASDEGDLNKAGFLEDFKQRCSQLILGLLADHGGNPIDYDIFEGTYLKDRH
ncbi:MAG: hypothetical protein LBL90_13845 [Prevotellaceae bacterium]|nr:hypothetical protein [Prevotellaceae bacterium]